MVEQPVSPIVVITLTHHVVAMNVHTGQRVWEAEVPMFDGQLYVEQGLVIYVIAGTVLCLDYLSGAHRWKTPLPSPINSGVVSILPHAGCILFSGLGETVCLSMQNGAQLWHEKFKGYGTGSGPMAAPGVAAQIDRGH